jgi:hypothetical protein
MALFSDWRYYITYYAQGQAAIGLYMDDMLDAAKVRPWLHWLRIEMIEPAAHGMFDEAPGDDLDKLDLDMEEFLLSKVDAALVGRISHGGYRTFYFYSTEKDDFEPVAKAYLSKTKYEYELGQDYDPEWKIYQNDLYPTPLEMWWMSVGEMVASLEDAQDVLEIPRRIDHWIYFADGAKRQTFIAEIEADKFSIADAWYNDSNDPQEGHEYEDLPYGLQIYRNDPAELTHMRDVVATLFQLSEKYDGHYGGLEAFSSKTDPQLVSSDFSCTN